jgi:hypothetical protein
MIIIATAKDYKECIGQAERISAQFFESASVTLNKITNSNYKRNSYDPFFCVENRAAYFV